MFGWQIATLIGVGSALILVALVIVALRHCYHASKQRRRVREATPPPPPPPTATTSTSRAIAETLESLGILRVDTKTKPNFNLFRRGLSTKPLFSWLDHPSLITDAFENGWSRFAFTNYSSYPSARSSLLGLMGDCHHQNHHQRETQVEMSWEVGDGSDDFMQKIKMNSGLKKISSGSSSSSSSSSSVAAKSSIRTSLPLPGPSVGNSFPQEAYFEIKILSVSSSHEGNEGEKAKLIEESNSNGNCVSDSKIHIGSRHGKSHPLEELRLGSRGGGDKGVAVMVSLGLAASTFNPLKIPGTYRGSIGFNSNGSVNLGGMKLVFDSEKLDWGQEEKTIGCGFDPRQKRVFFTVDSELIHVINCKSEEFGNPLYPVLAANADITVVVNLGQSRFSYEPANTTRTPNPCFIGPRVNSTVAVGYEDSGELFSMGRIDPVWVNHYMAKAGPNGTGNSSTNNNGNNRSKENEYDEESEADLFEIVLDMNKSYPNKV